MCNIAPSSSNYLVDRTKKFAELNSDSFQVELSKLNTHTVFLNSYLKKLFIYLKKTEILKLDVKKYI